MKWAIAVLVAYALLAQEARSPGLALTTSKPACPNAMQLYIPIARHTEPAAGDLTPRHVHGIPVLAVWACVAQ